MKQYLSYGGGVNSTAMLLLLHDEGQEFETIYVDHGCDWPETREYVEMMAERYPITILKPQVEGYDNLYEYSRHYSITPSRMDKARWCTQKFKVQAIHNYVDKPCFCLIGFSVDEEHRAKIAWEAGIENRFPLLEYEVDRKGCVDIIKAHGLPVPIKSGCWFCPNQRIGQWKGLRRKHPDLFCKAVQMENAVISRREKDGKSPAYFRDKPLLEVVKERQETLFADMKPPCQCGL